MADASARRVHSRRRLALLLVPIGAFTVASNIGAWFGPTIIVSHPLLEMFLNPANRYLALASNQVDAVSFYSVGFLRLVLTDPLFYLLGLWYGESAIAWTKRRSTGSAQVMRTIERWFARARGPIVFIAPNAIVCLLAGATRMRVVPFAILDVAGTAARLVLIRALADVFTGPLDAATRFIDRYQWWLVGISVVIGVMQLSRRRPKVGDAAPPDEEA